MVRDCSACADGTDDRVFVAGQVVGCDGTWSSGGIAGGASLCAAGWSVCGSEGQAAAKGLSSAAVQPKSQPMRGDRDLAPPALARSDDDERGRRVTAVRLHLAGQAGGTLAAACAAQGKQGATTEADLGGRGITVKSLRKVP